MPQQNINIEHVEKGGVVNIYNQAEEQSKTKETVTIAAIDKYSTPLVADIERTPWGKTMYRISFLMKNALIGQVLQQNYLTFKSEEKAEEYYKKIVAMIKQYKKKAEEELIHSAILVPQIWHEMEVLEKESDLNQPEASDLSYRFDNPEIHGDFMGATPRGLLLHPVENHFPEHEGIIKKASNNGNWYKKIGGKRKENTIFEPSRALVLLDKSFQNTVAAFDEIDQKLSNGEFDLGKFANKMLPKISDSPHVKNIKRKSLLHIRPVFKAADKKQWIEKNAKKIKEAVDFVGESLLWDDSAKKKINIDHYDLFIFDADNTIWDGDVPAAAMESPFKKIDEDTIEDSQGQEIFLRENIREILLKLKDLGRDIGLISKSEKPDVDYQDQPVIQLLKGFGILDLFNEMVVVDHDIPKSAFIPQGRRTVFIDDEIDNLRDVEENTDADVVQPKPVASNSEKLIFAQDFNPIDLKMSDGYEEINVSDYQLKDDDELLLMIEEGEWDSVHEFVDNLLTNGMDLQKNKEKQEKKKDKFIGAIRIKLTKKGMKKIADSEKVNWYKESFINKFSENKIVDGILYNVGENRFQENINVTVPIPLIDELWKKDQLYIGPEDEGMGNRRQGVKDFLTTGKGINPSYIYFDPERESVSFGDGRHTFSTIREMGKSRILVEMSPNNADELFEYMARKEDPQEDPNYDPEHDDASVTAKKNDWYKISKRDYIPRSETPDKPNDGKEYELDHKKPLRDGGKNKKENLQWIPKDKHKKKSQDSGDFEYGGKDRHKKLKKNPKSYNEYQKGCGEAKQKKDREELGEAGYSKKQKEVAESRWNKEKKKS